MMCYPLGALSLARSFASQGSLKFLSVKFGDLSDGREWGVALLILLKLAGRCGARLVGYRYPAGYILLSIKC
ncbi:hypothetical protein BJX76DRAFT_344270 [Aspergillus varians]